MSCDNYRASIVGLIYDDIDDAERSDAVAHLATCAECRDSMAGLEAARAQLRSVASAVPRAPRVLVVGRTSTPHRAWLGFAAGLVAALLAAGGTAAGYAYGSGRSAAAVPAPDPQVLVQREIDRRWEALKTELAAVRSMPVTPAPAPAAVTRDDLAAAMSRLERKIDGSRASDLDYVQNLIDASERRTGSWIGETQKALRYVALANDPALSEQ